MGLPRVVVRKRELWVLWVLGSQCWVLILLALVLKLDGRQIHDLRKTRLESATHHHVDGYDLAGESDEDTMLYGMMIAMDDSTATISMFEP